MFAKIITDYGGFDLLNDELTSATLEKFSTRLYEKFCAQFRTKDYMTNVRWILRTYSSAKKTLLSALFITQADHLEGLAMQNLQFYACYYAFFNALSSNLILHPDIPFDQVQEISHGQIFREIENYYIRFDIYDKQLLQLLSESRLSRELYSYHLPLGGTEIAEGRKLNPSRIFSDIQAALPRILQISNLQSFIAYYAWMKKVGTQADEYAKHQREVDDLFFSLIHRQDHLKLHLAFDEADYQSLGYMLNKVGQPFPISWFISEKMLDDLEIGLEQERSSTAAYQVSDIARYLFNTIQI